MYKILLLSEDDTVIQKMTSLDIWGKKSGFQVGEVRKKPFSTLDHYKGFELIIAEKYAGLKLLKRAVEEKQELRVALYSDDRDFEALRQGMILGARDYIAEPLDVKEILSMLDRIKGELNSKEEEDVRTVEKLITFFENRDKGYYDHLNSFIRQIKNESEDDLSAVERLKVIYAQLWNEIHEKHPWVSLYLNENTFRHSESSFPMGDFLRYSARFQALFEEFCELYPKHDSQLREVILTILNHPEQDLRQKTISSELHINATYLSTVFVAQTGVRFGDYVNTVKLKRVAWLLLNTSFGITEIADRLYYKDKSYFSKLFRTKYGVAPSLYRVPSDYDFQI